MSMVLEIPGKVIAGSGCMKELPELLKEHGFSRISVLVDVAVAKQGYVAELLRVLKSEGMVGEICTEIGKEPTFSSVLGLYRETGLAQGDAVLAVGGGSVIDTAKILCAMATNPKFSQNLRDTALIREKGIPLFAAPTTAGTGAEATPNAILFDEESKKKTGIVSKLMIADTVLLDAELTKSMPPSVAAATGFDALAHALESFTSRKANAYSDMFAIEAMRLVFGNLVSACLDGNAEARQKMLLASFYAGVCLVTSSTHLVHAMAYPLAEEYHVSHGKGIAALLAAGVAGMQSDRFPEIVERCFPKGSLAKDCAGKYQGTDAKELLYQVLETYGDTLGVERKLVSFGVKRTDCGRMAKAAMGNKRLFANCPGQPDLEVVAEIYRSLV